MKLQRNGQKEKCMADDKPLRIKVETFDPINDEVIGTREIDYNDRESRNWYIKNFIWAMTNGKAIEITPLFVKMKVLQNDSKT
jgi:hypothetical protein